MSAMLTPRQAELLDLVRRLQSATMASIAAAYETTPERCIYVLRILRKRGLVQCSHFGGRRALWHTPENASHASAAYSEHKAAARLAEVQRQRKRAVAKAARQRQYREQQAERWSRGMTQRIVPAREAPPLRVTVANSVWALGAAA
jgi:hypothetical protein